jgi:hypothetical protein
MNDNTKKILLLADGSRSSRDIASVVGLSARYVRKVLTRHGAPQLRRGAQPGRHNHQFVSGRRIHRDGYAVVTAPANHPYARQRSNRKGKLIAEHRLVMERVLGRYLDPAEIVDHIDGLTLHNAPWNLRLYRSNADHLRDTLSGRPRWSERGYKNIGIRTDLGATCQPVDTHGQRTKRGDVRLRQILLAALKLGIDSPYLLGTHRHLEKAGIDPYSHSSLTRALDDLSARWV